MECNRDEAMRAKSIAEGKLENMDFAGAKKFALKAQTLYPGLDGISQMLTIIDVYVSAENKISGEVDWYGVLGVNPSADDETIKKQYRKFALMMHPDKTKSVGAEGAFKLVSEAWTLFSDKTRRLAYNQRRGSNGFQHVPMHNGGASVPRTNGYNNFSGRTETVQKNRNKYVKVSRTSTPTASHQRTDTFWTICHQCKMHYEYVKIYLNSTLLCPNCKEAFVASETAPPFKYSKVTNQLPPRQQQNPGNHVSSRTTNDQEKNVAYAKKSETDNSCSNSFKYANVQQDSIHGKANVAGKDPSSVVKATNVIQQAQDKLKRVQTESHASTGWETYNKKRKLEEGAGRFEMNCNTAMGHDGFGTSSANAGSKFFSISGTYHQSNSIKELTPVETRNRIAVRARTEILKKVNEWRSETLTKPAVKEKEKTKTSKKEMHKNLSNFKGPDQNGDSDLPAIKKAELAEKRGVRHASDNVDEVDPAGASMDVPDPDFHDFDLDRAENSFGDNDVWAAYDNDDGMPRLYGLISKVVSEKPFKVRIGWLNSKTNGEFCNIDWVGSGFYKTCGEFRVGKYETCQSINAFSQKVCWKKGPRGSILIFPRKGDVWALYKNWSSDWNENTPDEIIHKYDMVMVLDDYNDEKGISVVPLVKVVGFRTVFHHNLCSEVIMRIPKEEMFRLSHRVPHHLLTGQEAENAPEGCIELDPAATPLELLQVTTEADVVPAVLKREKAEVDEQVLQSSKKRF